MLKSMVVSTGLQFTYEAAHAWVLATHKCLIDSGCVQTEDAGQYTNIPTTGAISSAVTLGYRIYEVNDAHSFLDPIYFKISFRVVVGANTHTTAMIGVFVLTVGFATDGAGNIIGLTAPTNYQLYTPSASNGGTVINGQGRTLAVKGDDFFYCGGQLGLAYIANLNIYSSGFFGIIRSKDSDGNVKNGVATVIFTAPNSNNANALSLRYQRLSKLEGVSNVNSNMHALPRINNAAGLLVATEADISEMGYLESTDTLVALRTSPSDTAWGVYELSVDNLTSRKYLHLPTAFLTISPTATYIPFNAAADTREGSNGCLGLIWDD